MLRRPVFTPARRTGPGTPVLPLLLTLATALSGSGCTEDFDPFNRLIGLRVLAIRSEPPTPGPGETATLSALIYTDTADPQQRLEWSWCPLAGPSDQGYPCQVGPEQIAMLEQAGITLPSFDLGSEATARLPHAIDPLILSALCEGTAGVLPTLPACEGGFPVQIKLKVSSGGQTITAVRDLRLRFDPATEPNSNPTIEGLLAEQGEEHFVPIGDQAPVTLPRDEETRIRAVVPEAAAESYDGLDNDRQPARVHERLVLTWFVETGDTRSEHTSLIVGEVKPEDFMTNEWTPPRTKDYDSARARLVVVIRDNRGGVAWTEGAVMLGRDP